MLKAISAQASFLGKETWGQNALNAKEQEVQYAQLICHNLVCFCYVGFCAGKPLRVATNPVLEIELVEENRRSTPPPHDGSRRNLKTHSKILESHPHQFEKRLPK
jgi:hypothetical protein